MESLLDIVTTPGFILSCLFLSFLLVWGFLARRIWTSRILSRLDLEPSSTLANDHGDIQEGSTTIKSLLESCFVWIIGTSIYVCFMLLTVTQFLGLALGTVVTPFFLAYLSTSVLLMYGILVWRTWASERALYHRELEPGRPVANDYDGIEKEIATMTLLESCVVWTLVAGVIVSFLVLVLGFVLPGGKITIIDSLLETVATPTFLQLFLFASILVMYTIPVWAAGPVKGLSTGEGIDRA